MEKCAYERKLILKCQQVIRRKAGSFEMVKLQPDVWVIRDDIILTREADGIGHGEIQTVSLVEHAE